MTTCALKAVGSIIAVGIGLFSASFFTACATHEKPTHRIEPGDIVFRNWSYLTAYEEEVGRIVAVSMAGITAADLGARSQELAARIKKETVDLTVRFQETQKTWQIPAGTVVKIVGYYDHVGKSTVPKVEGTYLYAADGNLLIGRLEWDGKEGYMALSETQ